MNQIIHCQCNYFMHLIVNRVLLALVGVLLVCELDFGFGMTLPTSSALYHHQPHHNHNHNHNQHNYNDQSSILSSESVVSSVLSSVSSSDIIDLNQSQERASFISSSQAQQHQQHQQQQHQQQNQQQQQQQHTTRSQTHCPSGPPKHWKSQLDVASKAYLAPIVFNGKLISISEDYGGRIGATFRVQKLIKNTSSFVPNLATGSQVTLYFVRNKHAKSEPPFCAIYMNDNLVKLRPEEKYIVFASPPMTSLSNSVYINVPNDANQPIRPTANSHTLINLSAFAPPELHTKRSSRLVRKVLCRRCAKASQIRELNGDLRVETKGRLRLRCKVSGNPSPRVEWFRNGKRLKSKGRVAIKTRRKMSRLEIRHVSPMTDSGYYECRAINAVAHKPSTARHRVIVTPLSLRGQQQPKQQHKQHEHINQHQKEKHKFIPPSSASSKITPTPTRGPLWPQIRPCPIPSFCLNGGTCTLYEAVGEYVCQCAEGYRGQRCESKDINFRYDKW